MKVILCNTDAKVPVGTNVCFPGDQEFHNELGSPFNLRLGVGWECKKGKACPYLPLTLGTFSILLFMLDFKILCAQI